MRPFRFHLVSHTHHFDVAFRVLECVFMCMHEIPLTHGIS